MLPARRRNGLSMTAESPLKALLARWRAEDHPSPSPGQAVVVIPAQAPQGMTPDARDDDVRRLLMAPLDAFRRSGQALEVRVPWWPTTLFFVPTPRDAEA